ncbi:hypothetical protein FQR65_LT20564 [Abscondita terminalis]|nr:hypothetical protein FQR65_LT20564 [Abscondita terminalis]
MRAPTAKRHHRGGGQASGLAAGRDRDPRGLHGAPTNVQRHAGPGQPPRGRELGAVCWTWEPERLLQLIPQRSSEHCRATRGVVIKSWARSRLAGVGAALGYSPSKGGVKMLTQSLARDLAATASRLTAIAPGVIETPMTASTREDPASWPASCNAFRWAAWASRKIWSAPPYSWPRPWRATSPAFPCRWTAASWRYSHPPGPAPGRNPSSTRRIPLPSVQDGGVRGAGRRGAPSRRGARTQDRLHRRLSASPSAQSGQAAVLGLKTAIEDINAAAGLLGRKVVLVVRDDLSQPPKSTNMNRYLIRQRKGSWPCSAPPNIGQCAGLEAHPKPETGPVMAPSVSGTDITNAHAVPAPTTYMFRVGQSALKDLEEVGAAQGVKAVAVEKFGVGDTDMTSQAQQASSRRAWTRLCGDLVRRDADRPRVPQHGEDQLVPAHADVLGRGQHRVL